MEATETFLKPIHVQRVEDGVDIWYQCMKCAKISIIRDFCGRRPSYCPECGRKAYLYSTEKGIGTKNPLLSQ